MLGYQSTLGKKQDGTDKDNGANDSYFREIPEPEENPATGKGISGLFTTPESSIAIGAKTLAGVGIGLLAVVAAAASVGVVTEAILVPSLLVKMAGGIAGGGLGMAKGLSDERRIKTNNSQ